MTAPVPASVETLAVQLAALSRRLDDALVSRDREEKIRVDELSAWRISHNEILASADIMASRMLPKTEYEERHKALESKLETTLKVFDQQRNSDLKFLQQRLDRMDDERNNIKFEVGVLNARKGYVSASFLIAIISVVIAISGVWVDFMHSIVSVKP